MYIWDIHSLKRDLISRPLTEREQLPYLVVFVALSTIGENLANELSNLWDYLIAVSSVIIAVGGAIYLYHANGGRSGHHFLQRFFAVGFVVSIRWLVAVVAALIPLMAILWFSGLLQDTTTWAEFILLAAAELFLYQRVGHHIRDVALQTATREP